MVSCTACNTDVLITIQHVCGYMWFHVLHVIHDVLITIQHVCGYLWFHVLHVIHDVLITIHVCGYMWFHVPYVIHDVLNNATCLWIPVVSCTACNT